MRYDPIYCPAREGKPPPLRGANHHLQPASPFISPKSEQNAHTGRNGNALIRDFHPRIGKKIVQERGFWRKEGIERKMGGPGCAGEVAYGSKKNHYGDTKGFTHRRKGGAQRVTCSLLRSLRSSFAPVREPFSPWWLLPKPRFRAWEIPRKTWCPGVLRFPARSGRRAVRRCF